MALTEKEIDYLEQQIPELAEMALRKAYWQTLASGDSVLVADDGQLIDVQPDGTRTVLKTIEKPETVRQKHFRITEA